MQRPIVSNQEIPNLNWIAGFTSGEGCFFVHIYLSKTRKLGEAVKLEFQLTQHLRDEQLLISFIEYFKCGYVVKKINAVEFRVTKFQDINEKIIPFFKKSPIVGVKAKDFEDWCQVASLMEEKKTFNSWRSRANKKKSKQVWTKEGNRAGFGPGWLPGAR